MDLCVYGQVTFSDIAVLFARKILYWFKICFMCRSVGMADYVYSSANRAGDLISLKIICDTSIQRILIDLLNAGGFNIIDYV